MATRKEKAQGKQSRAKKRILKIKQLLVETGLKIPIQGTKEYNQLYVKLAKGQKPTWQKVLKDVMEMVSDLQHKEPTGPLAMKTSRKLFEKASKSKRSYEMGRYYSKC